MGGALVGVCVLGIFMVFGFFFVIFMMRKATKDHSKAKGFVPEFVARSGLRQQGSAFVGNYRGYDTRLEAGTSVNWGKMAFGGVGGMLQGDINTMNSKFRVVMRAPGHQIPPTVLKEKVSFWRTDQWINERLAGRQVNLQPIPGLRIGRAEVLGTDPNLAQKLCGDPDLQRLLSDWQFADLRLAGDVCEVVLDDPQMLATLGSKLQSTDFLIQMLEICARAMLIATWRG